MNHITVRRMALASAATSFSLLTAIVLVVSVVYGQGSMHIKPAATLEISVNEDIIIFPASISCTSLVVEKIVSYDGQFFEDGSGREVFDTAAILLKNTGQDMIPYAHVVLRTQCDSYVFDGFWLPPDASVIIPEKYGLAYIPHDEYISCFGWSTVADECAELPLAIENVDMSSVMISNTSEIELCNLTLYHRSYLPENDLYIGGNVFTTRIPCIAARESVVISPQYYASGYSKIIYCE